MANPAIASLLNLVPGVINTVVSVVKDKKAKKALSAAAEVVENNKKTPEKIAQGFSLSGKRIINLSVQGVVLTTFYSDYTANGLTKVNLCLLGIGGLIGVGLEIAKAITEK